MTTRQFRATSDDAAFDVEVKAETVSVCEAATDGAAADTFTFTVSSNDRDGLRVRHNDGERRALTASHGDRTWVWIDGEAFTIDVEAAERARRPRAPAGAEGLSAPMPATVIRILVEPGKDVRRGETLLLLEAMKMELPVRAPRDGRVTAVHCQPGELVQPGVTLVDLA